MYASRIYLSVGLTNVNRSAGAEPMRFTGVGRVIAWRGAAQAETSL